MPRPVTISYAPEIKLLTVFSEELDSVSILTPTPECQLSQRQSTSILGATVLCILLFGARVTSLVRTRARSDTS
ncbi:hypothetical protein CPC08DRAFT_702336 [Agrocybe pediades]|nr:hypothetical protein CPC08DRAFT_702336 [Agrocybe pediades]